jgi:hypothetical protein
LFAGGSASGSGNDGTMIVPMAEFGIFACGVRFIAAAGFDFDLICLRQPRRDIARAIAGMVGSLMLVATAALPINGWTVCENCSRRTVFCAGLVHVGSFRVSGPANCLAHKD